MLSVQGVRTKCVVANPEEAGRLCGRFMTDGGLTYFFDTRLHAPVLYGEFVPALVFLGGFIVSFLYNLLVADENLDTPQLTNIPRTVSQKFHQKMLTFLGLEGARS